MKLRAQELIFISSVLILIIFASYFFFNLTGNVVLSQECSDGKDNDGDGAIDLDDIGCYATNKTYEMVNGDVLLGVNLGRLEYWTNEWVFTNFMKSSSLGAYKSFGSEIPDRDLVPKDENGYPLEIPFIYEGKSYTFQPKFFYDDTKYFPLGVYTILYDGEGKLNFEWNNAKVISSEPGKYLVEISNIKPDQGIQMTILESKKGNHIRNIRIIPPGLEENQTFHPVFVERLANSSVIRFMDLMKTNSQNIVNWNDRTPKGYYTQSGKVILKNISISSINKIPDNQFSGKWPVEVKTKTPHGLTTGQIVKFSGTDAYLRYKNESGDVITSILEKETRMVEVVDAYTFRTDIFHPGWKRYRLDGNPYNYPFVEFKSGTKGNLVLEINSGIAYEYIAELANTVSADPWITVPHLADDEFVRNLARLMKNNLEPERKVYLEYSNELWNSAGGFRQTQYAEAMGRKTGLGTHNFKAKRSAEIFKIFEEELGDERVINVVAGQAASTSIGEQFIKGFYSLVANPSKTMPEVYAIAPYFGDSNYWRTIKNNGDFERLSVEQIINGLIASLSEDTSLEAQRNKLISDKYNLSLVAYEGGQHLSVNSSQSPKLKEIWKHPKMKNLYDEMFKGWYGNGGELFLHYTYVSKISDYSWGMLEYQDQPVSEAPRYQSYLETMKELGDSRAISPPPANQTPEPEPTPEPVCGNGILEFGELCDGESRICEIDGAQGIESCNSECNGWECVVEEEPTPEPVCTLTSANWVENSSIEGEYVRLDIYSENCFGERIIISVWEDDGLFGDDFINNFTSVLLGNPITSVWKSVWVEDMVGSPEYYFYVTLTNQTNQTIQSSNLLKVSKLSAPVQNNTNTTSPSNDTEVPDDNSTLPDNNQTLPDTNVTLPDSNVTNPTTPTSPSNNTNVTLPGNVTIPTSPTNNTNVTAPGNQTSNPTNPTNDTNVTIPGSSNSTENNQTVSNNTQVGNNENEELNELNSKGSSSGTTSTRTSTISKLIYQLVTPSNDLELEEENEIINQSSEQISENPNEQTFLSRSTVWTLISFVLIFILIVILLIVLHARRMKEDRELTKQRALMVSSFNTNYSVMR